MFGDDSHNGRAYHEVTNAPHKASLSHELIAGAAAFAAAKAYEKHCAENGKPVNHAMAKELLAGFAGAFIDRMVETKGLDFIDHQRAKHEAMKHFEEPMADHYPGSFPQYPGQYSGQDGGSFSQYPGQAHYLGQYGAPCGQEFARKREEPFERRYENAEEREGFDRGRNHGRVMEGGGIFRETEEDFERRYENAEEHEGFDRGRHHEGLLGGGVLGGGLLGGGLLEHRHHPHQLGRHHEGHHERREGFDDSERMREMERMREFERRQEFERTERREEFREFDDFERREERRDFF